MSWRPYTDDENATMRSIILSGGTTTDLKAALPHRSMDSLYKHMNVLMPDRGELPDPRAARRTKLTEMARSYAEQGHSMLMAAKAMSEELGEPISRSQIAGIARRGGFAFKCTRPVTHTPKPESKRGSATWRETKRLENTLVRRARKARAEPVEAPKPPPKPVKADADFSRIGKPEFYTGLLNGAPMPSKTHRVYLPDIPGPKQCRHITGDIREPRAFWCGNPVSEGSSYCPCHRVICTALSDPADRKRAREMLAEADG